MAMDWRWEEERRRGGFGGFDARGLNGAPATGPAEAGSSCQAGINIFLRGVNAEGYMHPWKYSVRGTATVASIS